VGVGAGAGAGVGAGEKGAPGGVPALLAAAANSGEEDDPYVCEYSDGEEVPEDLCEEFGKEQAAAAPPVKGKPARRGR
jgi:hypothetical protein